MDDQVNMVSTKPVDACEAKCDAKSSVNSLNCASTPSSSREPASLAASDSTGDCSLICLPQAVENLKITDSTDEVQPKQCQGKGSRKRMKTRSLYGVSPHCKFGPKGFLKDCTAAFLKIPDPSSQKLTWLKTPLSVLVIKKPYDATVTSAFRDLVVWLVQEKNLVVFVEESVVKDNVLSRDPQFLPVQDRLHKFKEGVDELEDKVDFIICLGGDGTLLYASSLFQQSVPPVIAFNMGSLGFLTPFPFCSFKERINNVIKGQAPLLLRYRLKCLVQNHGNTEPISARPPPMNHIKRLDSSSDDNISSHILVLNEVVIDRGPSSYPCNLDLYIEGHLVTSVLGDGLIISTPTGSTAYSVAAGASMIHPNVPCILLTPICPHSLSFRPIVLPAGVEVKVTLAPEARGTAMVSFDGRNRQQIHQGVSLRVTTASYPVPSICAQGQIEDWFSGLADCLHWNVRKTHKSLTPSISLTSLESVDLEAVSK